MMKTMNRALDPDDGDGAAAREDDHDDPRITMLAELEALAELGPLAPALLAETAASPHRRAGHAAAPRSAPYQRRRHETELEARQHVRGRPDLNARI
jgi:hypothetical protein